MSDLWQIFTSSACQDEGLQSDRVGVYVRTSSAGIRHLHGLNVVHGDLSLKKIFVSEDHSCRIGDFGSARSAHDFVARPGKEITTLYVRAPEKLLGGATSRPIDMWAMGVIAMALLVGEVPWLESEVAVDVFGALLLFIGPIATWAARLDLPFWEQFREAHASRLVDAEALDADIKLRVRCVRQTELPTEAESVIEFIAATLRWDPLTRISASGALSMFLVQEYTRSSRQEARSVSTPPSVSCPSTMPASPHSVAHISQASVQDSISPVAAESSHETVDDDTCKCSGNCGCKAHRKRAKQKKRPCCLFKHAPDSDKCRDCTCLLCPRPRSHINAITCVTCGDKHAKLLKKGYINRHRVYFSS